MQGRQAAGQQGEPSTFTVAYKESVRREHYRLTLISSLWTDSGRHTSIPTLAGLADGLIEAGNKFDTFIEHYATVNHVQRYFDETPKICPHCEREDCPARMLFFVHSAAEGFGKALIQALLGSASAITGEPEEVDDPEEEQEDEEEW